MHLSNLANHFRRTPYIVLLLLFLVAGGGFLFYHFSRPAAHPQAMLQDLEQISSASYDTVFFSMYPIGHYKKEDFVNYRGWNPIFSSYQPQTLTELSAYLDAAFSRGNVTQAICLGLDPYQIWLSNGGKTKRWNQDLQKKLLNYIKDTPSLQYNIFLPCPSIDYWLSLNETELEYAFAAYKGLIAHLSVYDNVSIFFLGAEEWLIENPGNYDGYFDFNDSVAHKIFLFTFCDQNAKITPYDMETCFSKLEELITRKRQDASPLPDLSDWEITFWGDISFDAPLDSLSLPGAVTNLSGASTYSYVISSAKASDPSDYDISFPGLIDGFCTGSLSPAPYSPDMGSMQSMGSMRSMGTDASLCFVISYGITDYFAGTPIDNKGDPLDTQTFAGALRTGIGRLKETYPNAVILLVTPAFCYPYHDQPGETGGTLSDYVDAIVEIAREENLPCLNLAVGLEPEEDTNASYYFEEWHLKESGYFLLAQKIIALLEERTLNQPF